MMKHSGCQMTILDIGWAIKPVNLPVKTFKHPKDGLGTIPLRMAFVDANHHLRGEMSTSSKIMDFADRTRAGHKAYDVVETAGLDEFCD